MLLTPHLLSTQKAAILIWRIAAGISMLKRDVGLIYQAVAASLRWYYPDQVPAISSISSNTAKKTAFIIKSVLKRIENANLSLPCQSNKKGVPAHASTLRIKTSST